MGYCVGQNIKHTAPVKTTALLADKCMEDQFNESHMVGDPEPDPYYMDERMVEAKAMWEERK